MLLGNFIPTVYDRCPYVRIKSAQITPSFATRKSSSARLAPNTSSPASRATALPFPTDWLAKQGLSGHVALTLTGAAPGREGADIPALPVKSAFQRLCLGVGKNKEGLSVHMQNPTLFCPNCQAVVQDHTIPVPTCLFPPSKYQYHSVTQAPFLFHPLCQNYIHLF